jgi:integrase/recombinase XerC
MNALTVQATNSIIVATPAISEELLSRFIAYLDTSPKTIETYKKALKQAVAYFSLNGISKPTREDVIAFRDELKASGKKPTTVQNYITACKLFFSYLAQEGIYSTNITEHLKGAKLDRAHKKDYLTSRQVREVLDNIKRDSVQGIRDYAILSLMVTCGLRDIEVSRANIADMRTLGDHTVLYVQGKGRQEKTEFVKISEPVERAIRDYLKTRGEVAEEEPLFTSLSNNSTGKRLTTRSISGTVKTRLKQAGFNSDRLTAHSLRHTAVTLSLLAGKELAEVQQFARHANIATTMIYNHSLDRMKNGCSDAITKAIF